MRLNAPSAVLLNGDPLPLGYGILVKTSEPEPLRLERLASSVSDL